MSTRIFRSSGFLVAALAMVAIVSTALCIPDVVTACTAATHALQVAMSMPTDAGAALLCAAPLVMKFQVRDGFVATTYTRADLGDGRSEIRTNNFFGGEVTDFTLPDADANLQKLEPKDQAAYDYMASKHTQAEQPASPASIDSIVAKAVADAIAAFTAGLQAASAVTAAATAATAAKPA